MRRLGYFTLLVIVVGPIIGCNSDVELKRDKTKELQVTARLRIHDSKLEDFKALAAKCLQSVRENDTGTLQYDWFFNEDQSECIVREWYTDSDALLEHIANLGETFGSLLSVSDLSVEVYGTPSSELIKATEGIDSMVYSYFQGL